MARVKYAIVEHDGGWAYKVDGTFSETFRSREAAHYAACRAALEQQQPGDDRRRSPGRTSAAAGTPRSPAAATGPRSRSRTDPMAGCTQLVDDPRPSRRARRGCEECLGRGPVGAPAAVPHLRPRRLLRQFANRHATKHFHATQHPIITSAAGGLVLVLRGRGDLRPLRPRDAAARADPALRVRRSAGQCPHVGCAARVEQVAGAPAITLKALRRTRHPPAKRAAARPRGGREAAAPGAVGRCPGSGPGRDGSAGALPYASSGVKRPIRTEG